jgi:glycosyltransferase involved in cell wall biosynthesis
MKICVLANHAWPHVGGCEKVIHELAKRWVSRHGHEVVVDAESNRHQEDRTWEGVLYSGSADALLNGPDVYLKYALSYFDVVLVYSDRYAGWKRIVCRAEEISAEKYLVPLGMYATEASESLRDEFSEKRQHFRVITHNESYDDTRLCDRLGIPYTVIPNGASPEEFVPTKTREELRKIYGIDTEFMLLYVGNFFPGKGQEHLLQIAGQLRRTRKDVTTVFVANSSTIPMIRHLTSAFRQAVKLRDTPVRLLEDLPRQDVVNAFCSADLFVLPSQKEVAPVCLVESMAAGLPWVSLDVGNVRELQGGWVYHGVRPNEKGMMQYTPDVHAGMARFIDELLGMPSERGMMGRQGRNAVGLTFNWDAIADRYEKLFQGKPEEVPGAASLNWNT